MMGEPYCVFIDLPSLHNSDHDWLLATSGRMRTHGRHFDEGMAQKIAF
jgi:hypothetical protein